jgi:hypothetical protein
MKNILFISVQDIKDRTGLHNNVDEKLIHPEILTAQDMYILPLLGSTLYNRLQDGIQNNNINTAENKLLDEYIVPTLVYFVMSELPMGLSFQFYTKGLIRKTDANQTEPDMQDVLDVAARYKARAEFYRQRTLKYLKAETSNNTYPQYTVFDNRYDTMYPEQQSYTTTFWLADDDCCKKKSFEEKYQGNINRDCSE